MDKSKVKQKLHEELNEWLVLLIYLAVAFCFLATMKSMILLQLGIDDFVHGYTVALIEALALSKIVLLGQKIPALKAVDKRPIVVSSLFKGFILAIIVFIGSIIEEKVFAHHAADAPLKQRIILDCAHFSALVLVFYMLFIYKQLEAVLGGDKLKSLLCSPQETNGEA